MCAFRDVEIRRLARNRLQARRRKQSTVKKRRSGRPSRQGEIKKIISEAIDRKRWSTTASIKALTHEVNRLGTWFEPVSEDSVQRALSALSSESKDRRFERVVRRVSDPKAAA